MSRKNVFACSSCKSTFDNQKFLTAHRASHNDFQTFPTALASTSRLPNSHASSISSPLQVSTQGIPLPAQPLRALPPVAASPLLLTNQVQVSTQGIPPPAQPLRAFPPVARVTDIPRAFLPVARATERARKSHPHTFGCYRVGSDHRTLTGVVLDGKRSYLKSSPLLDRLGVRVHVTLRCLLCVECGRAFVPKSMATHLAQRHNICTSEDDREGLLDFSRANSVGDQPWDGPLPTNYGPPVELVSEQAGFACGIGEQSL
jgi:hypothetical protein